MQDEPDAGLGGKVLLQPGPPGIRVRHEQFGQFVGHRPYHEAYERPNEIDWDVTAALRPGKTNTVVVRVHTGMGAAAQASGLPVCVHVGWSLPSLNQVCDEHASSLNLSFALPRAAYVTRVAGIDPGELYGMEENGQ